MAIDMNGLLEKALVTGAGGMIGSYVDFGIKTDRRALDVTNLSEVLRVCRKEKPRLIVHLAAETNVDQCEKDGTHAYQVNAVGTYHMALAAREIGAKLVYASTSGVFDGAKPDPYTEQDQPSPRTLYAHSKYFGELAVQGLLSDYLILRIAWVFGGGPAKDQKFVAKILEQVGNPVINVVSGTRGSPTYGKDFVAGMRQLIEEGKTGLYHMGNAGAPTRADLVREIVRVTGSHAEVREVPPSFFGLPADAGRAGNESMTSRVAYMRPWQEALDEYIRMEWPDSILGPNTPTL